jgi:uncharacterized membrane protein
MTVGPKARMAGREKDRVHQLFLVSIVGKGALAILECISGLALTFASTQTIVTLVGKATQGEIAEDPRDLIASHLMTWAAGFSAHNKAFYAWYFLSHGIVKLLIVAALLSGRLWAFPLSIAALGLFIAYQAYRYTFAPSAGLVALTIFDLVIIALVIREYRQALRDHAGSRAAAR